MAGLAEYEKDYVTARAMYAQAATTCQELGDAAGLASALARHGLAAALQGELQEAERLCERAVSLARGPGHTVLAWACLDLAYVRFIQEQYAGARELCLEAVGMADERDHGRHWQSAGLRGLACIASARGQSNRALRLFGTAAALRPIGTGLRFDAFDDRIAEDWKALAAEQLGPEAALAAISSGREMSVQQALAYALQD
jgi:tetratricopeptide (TPR) repeat protein